MLRCVHQSPPDVNSLLVPRYRKYPGDIPWGSLAVILLIVVLLVIAKASV